MAEQLIRQFLVSGTVTAAPIPDELFSVAMDTASAPAVMTEGKPTIMLVEAWMLHEGKNLNGDVFRADDLEMIAAQVTEPNFLPMDWNHSTRWGEGQVVGVWYSAAKEYNPKARDGKGAWGVKARGMLWAWAYPDKATSLLADMERDGFAAFSMMCIANEMQFGRDAEGYYNTLIEPVMYALSALSVPPGDPDANGVAVEGGAGEVLTDKMDERVRRWQAAAVELFAPFATATLTTQGATMDLKELETLVAELRAANEALTTEKAQLETEKAAAETALAEIEKSLDEAVEEAAAAVADAATDTSATPEELQVALEALKQSHAELEAQRDAEIAKNAELTAKLQEHEAAAQESAFAETREARFNQLPKEYRDVLAKRGEDVVIAFKERWAKATEDSWETFKDDIALANPSLRMSYRQMSEAEGGALPGTGEGAESISDILARTK